MVAPVDRPTVLTRLATMSLVDPGFVEQRFHSGARLDLLGFAENKQVRLELTSSAPHVMLSVLPPNVDFDVQVTTMDHFGPERQLDTIKALAVVAQDHVSEMVTKLFFSYFPPGFPCRVFEQEDEARAWLMERKREQLGA